MPAGEDICTDCGLCCDGALYGRIQIRRKDAQDAHFIRSQGVAITACGEDFAYELPCPLLNGALCRIYDDRPVVCREYRCRMRMSVDNGETSIAQAREKIAEVRALQDDIAALDPRGFAEQRRLYVDNALSGPDGLATARLNLKHTALNRFLDRYFRHEKERLCTEGGFDAMETPTVLPPMAR